MYTLIQGKARYYTHCVQVPLYIHTHARTHVQANGHGDPSRSQSFRRAFKRRTTPHSAHRPPMDRAEAKGQKVSLPVDRCCHLSLKTARLGTLSFFFSRIYFLALMLSDESWGRCQRFLPFCAFKQINRFCWGSKDGREKHLRTRLSGSVVFLLVSWVGRLYRFMGRRSTDKAPWWDVPHSSCFEQTVPVPNWHNHSNVFHLWRIGNICRLAYLSCAGRSTGRALMCFHYLSFHFYTLFFVIKINFIPCTFFSNSLLINVFPFLYYNNFFIFSFHFVTR